MTTPDYRVICATTAGKLVALRSSIRARGSALVAFSGGVDSTLVLKVASDELGPAAVAFTASSPAMPQEELDEASRVAASIGARHVVVRSQELERPEYRANASDRCYFCKSELHRLTALYRQRLALAVVLDGLNADERGTHRPGMAAAKEQGVASPLAEVGMTKAEIRAWSRELGLPTWDKPQLACLASRIPYGTAVTAERLTQVGEAERSLKALGLKVFRVRYHGDVARLELGEAELAALGDPALRSSVDKAVKDAGFTFVAMDLEPFRTGRMNDVLKQPKASPSEGAR